jgi:hypothetical protein
MSSRLIAAMVMVIVCLAVLTPVAAADERHSGKVVAVDAVHDRSGTIVVDEVGPWRTRKGVTQLTRHSIIVTPSTKITSYIRVNLPGRYQSDFLEVPFELGDVARGDFVTVEFQRVGRLLVASRIDVAGHAPVIVVP